MIWKKYRNSLVWIEILQELKINWQDWYKIKYFDLKKWEVKERDVITFSDQFITRNKLNYFMSIWRYGVYDFINEPVWDDSSK